MGFLNVLVLLSLRATTQQQDQTNPVLRVVDPVAWAIIDSQLAHAATDAFPITAKIFGEPVQSGHDAETGSAVAQAVEPIADRNPAGGGLVPANFNCSHCSLKATRTEDQFLARWVGNCMQIRAAPRTVQLSFTNGFHYRDQHTTVKPPYLRRAGN
jgi:hypothetical protein